MFGHDSKPCMVYEYGCLAPVFGEEALLAEMRRRNDFWNKLVEIDHDYRAKVKEVLHSSFQEQADFLAEELKRVEDAINVRRQSERSGKADISELKVKAKELKAALTEARQNAKEERKKLVEANRPILDALDVERKEAVMRVKRESGLYWTNADDVLASYDAARKKAMREGVDLKFHRWAGEGKIFIRYQYGLPVSHLFGNDARLQVDPVPEEAWDSPQRSIRRKAARTKVRIRVGSDGRRPVWAELPMVMHRPIPQDSEIRSAAVIRFKVGEKYCYKLIVTATIPEGRAVLRRERRAVGIDVGWRAVENGLRVVYWVDDLGNHGELVLGHDILHGFIEVSDLQSIRDTYFNDAQAFLVAWLADNSVPDWLREATETLASWKSSRRLAALVRRWRDNRFDGDSAVFNEMNWWLSRENHLFNWQVNLRDQVLRRRREEYRKFAAWLARTYSLIVFEDFDLRWVSRKPTAENGTQGSLPPDRQRFIAAVSELRQAVESTCRREGTDVIRVEAAFTTISCHVCGHTEKFDAAKHIWHTCPACGALYDQDYNAAVNLLAKSRLLQENRVS